MKPQAFACAVLQSGSRYLLMRDDDHHSTPAPSGLQAAEPVWWLPRVALRPGSSDPTSDLAHLIAPWQAIDREALQPVHRLIWGETEIFIYYGRPAHTTLPANSNLCRYYTWLTQEEIAIWHIAGRLNHQSDLEVIQTCQQAGACDA